MRKVFISHSATGDAFASCVRDLVTERLRERGYDVLVDTDGIVIGEDWGPHLYQWLEECQAAVILLSGKALSSRWVQREVNILLWRRSRNPSFMVVPALLGIDAAAVEAAGLSELQPVEAARCAGTSEADAGALVDAVTARFSVALPPASDDPMRRWLRRVARALHTVPPSQRDVLRRAAHHFDVPPDLPVEWSQEEACRLLAAQFLGAGLQGRRLEHALWAVAESLDPGPFGRLQIDALPAWVDAEAARRLLPPHRGTEPYRMMVFLDVSNLSLAADYLARAMCREVPDYDFETMEAGPVGDSPVADLLDDCRSAVRHMLVLDDYETLAPAVERPDDKVHYLLLHPGQAPPHVVAQAVVLLHDDCPWLVVVVLGANGRMTPADLTAAGARRVITVEPALRPGDEQLARQLRKAVVEMAAKAYG